MLAFFFSSRRRHTRYIGDWSSDVCSSDLIPMAYARLSETYGPSTRLDLPGLGLVSGGLLAVVWGLVRANELGWTSATILGSFAVGIFLLASFVAWEARSAEPMLPLRLFRSRSFSAANVVSMLM